MSRYIKLSGVRFTNPNLPVLRDLTSEVAAIPGLMSHFTAAAGFVSTNEAGQVTSWEDRAGTNTLTPTLAIRPAYGTDSATGKQAVQFVEGISSQLLWSGSFPVGSTASGKFTKILVARMDGTATTGNRFLLGFYNTAEGTDGYHHMRSDSSYTTLTSVIDPVTGEGGTLGTPMGDTKGSPVLLGSSFDPVVQKLSNMVNGTVQSSTLVAGQVTKNQCVLGGPALGVFDSAAPGMTVYDVMIFNSDLIGDAANAASLEIIRAYAKSRLGIV